MAYKNVNSSKKVNRSVYMEAEDLASIGCSMEVIATILDIDSETLSRNPKYAKSIKKGRSNMIKSLLHKQVEVALSGNTTMLVWLGKQYLGQSDRQEVANTFNSEQPTSLEFKITNQEDKGRLEKLESEICGKNSGS